MITLLSYKNGKTKEIEYNIASVQKLLKEKTFFWIDSTGIEKNEVEALCSTLKLHHLVIEDIETVGGRTKLEEYDDYLFLVTYGISRTHELRSHEIDIVMGKRFVATFHRAPVERFEELTRNTERLALTLKRGPEFLVYELLDLEVDNAISVLETINNQTQRLEEDVVKKTDGTFVPSIMHLKRDLLHARKVIMPLRDIVSSIAKSDVSIICTECVLYFRDLHDHLASQIEMIDTQREILNNVMEVYLSTVSNNINETMKGVTVLGTIMLPATAIGAIYGMNFQYMPELVHPYGYFITMSVIVGVTLLMLLYFKVKKWI